MFSGNTEWNEWNYICGFDEITTKCTKLHKTLFNHPVTELLTSIDGE